MLVRRWQAPRVPDIQQIKILFEAEGLEPFNEEYPKGATVTDHRHPFDEVRMVASGELVMNVAGNKLLLRPGDRITIPSNTKHSMETQGDELCVCVCANKVY
ncbi:MAG: cupin domain-containing protein [Pseudobdellovibrionaceae bacterium]|nr:cupin domain-containing protein [Bdellovibrionales bacterium]USN47457.1 MAG: cupin domain-containing protein [Pseudobdellovibrionaceae bacterium]